MSDEFTCALCHGTFEKAWTEEEALAEYHAAFNEKERADVREIVCDECYVKVMAWKHARQIELERRRR